MDAYTVTGAVVVVLISLVGFYFSVKKNIASELKPMEDLNINIVKLNANFEHMLESDDVRDKRINKHGEEIDEIREQQMRNEKVLDRHEMRLDNIEKKLEG